MLNQALLAAILDSATDLAIVTLDLDGVLTSWNAGAQALFGWTEAEALGQPVALLFTEEERAQGVPYQEMRDALQQGRINAERWHQRQDGTQFWASGRMLPLRQNNAIIGFLKILRDRTASLKLERDREQLTTGLTRRVTQLKALAEAARVITSAPNLKATVDAITEAARHIVGAHQSVVSMTRGEHWSQSITSVSLSDKYAAWRHLIAIPDGKGIYAYVCETNQPMRLTQAELQAHPRWQGFGNYADRHSAMRGWLAVPLIGKQGENLGVIQLSDKYEGEFDEADEAIVVQLAQFASAAIENAHTLEQLHESEVRGEFERELLSSVLEQAPLGISIIEADTGQTLMINRHLQDLLTLSLTREDLSRYQRLGAVHADGSAYTVEEYPTVRALRTGQTITRELMRYRRDDKEQLSLEVSSSPVRNAQGEIVAAVTVVADIGERLRQESALRDQSNQLAALINQAAVGICQFDLNGHIVMVNQRYCTFMGRSEDELLGQHVISLTHPDDRDASSALMQQLVTSGEPFLTDKRYVRPDGSERWASVHVSLVRGPDGEAQHISSVVVDIDERKRTEASLHLSNQRFRAAVDAVQGVLWTANTKGRMDGEQPAWSALTGQRYEEYQGTGWTHVLHPDDAVRSLRRWRTALKERKTFIDEQRVRCRNGEWRIFSVRAIPVLEKGAICEWVGVHTDITNVRHTEQRLRQLNETLEQRVAERTAERDRTWALSDDLLGVFAQGQWRSLNPAWTRQLGWTTAELLAFDPNYLEHPDDPHPSEYFRQLSIGQGLNELSSRYRTRANEWCWINWKATVDSDGQVYVYGRDVTAERESTVMLKQAEEALRQSQKMEAVGQLTGGIAHDFNNLLTGIIGSLEIMKRRIANSQYQDLERYMEAAGISAHRAATLTQRLLAFARRQTLDPQPVDLNELVLSLEELIRRTLGEHIEILTHLQPGLWHALSDTNQLENALLNLVINARDAMPQGGMLLLKTGNFIQNAEHSLEDLPPGHYVTLAVRDSGTGMSPEVLAKAFDPFYTTKPIGQGTGLGLSMIYGFLKQSGGHVTLQSAEGQGTTVTLYLPRAQGPDIPETLPEETTTPAGKGESILVVGDDPAVRLLVVEVLDELGYQASEAHNAQSALAKLELAQPVDLLITDVGLPGMSGVQLAERARMTLPDLKVLFMTGYTGEAVQGQGVMKQGAAIIGKPFLIEELATQVRTLLDSHSL
ncbi:PAS domain S-box-containing protein [Pseudomonas duriflava]|uniref:histidine kinase n=1 Tax=Pseudomonas duriflava TaxID=459528 RepID=A0A562QLQ1_9PSED|nr:PAS domain S-box protein [Pseudomonas duriflava]TWI57654.1 PAS domain S-box-containing protein [Pseudomonas duriflava]